MRNSYFKNADNILKKLNIKTKDISSKKEIIKSNFFVATLKPSKVKIIIK